MTDKQIINLEIAKLAYAEVVRAIQKFEDEYPEIYLDLPNFIDVNGERFTKQELALYFPIIGIRKNDR